MPMDAAHTRTAADSDAIHEEFRPGKSVLVSTPDREGVKPLVLALLVGPSVLTFSPLERGSFLTGDRSCRVH
jgi:hypothetical protein